MPSAHVRTAPYLGQLLIRPAVTALAAVAYFVLSIVALHFLRLDLDPVSQTTSQYAVGDYGALMTSAFFSMVVASLALVVGLFRGIVPPARTRLGLGLLVLWSLGVLTAMVFPINPDGMPLTDAALLHRIAGPVAFLSLALGAIVVGRRLQQDPRWRPVQRPAEFLALLMLLGFAVTSVNIVAGLGYAGLSQRVLLAIVVAWFALVAQRLFALGRGAT